MNVLGETKLQIKEEHSKIPLTILSKGQYLEPLCLRNTRSRQGPRKVVSCSSSYIPAKAKAVLAKPKKANVLFDLNLTSRSGREINSKLFSNKECTDVDSVLDLERALQQVGYGTGREDDFDNAIVMEDIEGEYVFSFESDGSMPAQEIFNRVCDELVSRFEKITGEIDIAFA